MKHWKCANTRKGYWRIANSPIIDQSTEQSILGNLRIKVNLTDRYNFIKLSNRRIPNGTYGGVRGRGLIAPSYSIIELKEQFSEIRKGKGNNIK